jgi:hypothetical protein
MLNRFSEAYQYLHEKKDLAFYDMFLLLNLKGFFLEKKSNLVWWQLFHQTDFNRYDPTGFSIILVARCNVYA